MTNDSKRDAGTGRRAQRFLIRELRKAKKALEKNGNPQSAIHLSRQCLKKVRAVLELVRDEAPYVYRVETLAARNISKSLAPYRDTDAMIETLDRIREGYSDKLPADVFDSIGQSFHSLHEAKKTDRTNMADDIASATMALDAAARRLRLAPLDGVSIKSVTAARNRSLRRMHKSRTQALQSHDPGLFHRWRRRTKTLFYQEQFLKKLGRSSKQARRELKTIGDLLGCANDAAMLNAYLEGIPDSLKSDQNIEILRSLAQDQQSKLHSKALAATVRTVH